MPRQSFLSADFFVATTEENAGKALVLLPTQNRHICLVRENSNLHTMRFSFDHTEKSFPIYIDVSLLPLNDQFVRFRLHGFYTNERRIEDNTEIELALSCFKKLAYEALQIDYPAEKIKQRTPSSIKSMFRSPASFLSMLLFKPMQRMR